MSGPETMATPLFVRVSEAALRALGKGFSRSQLTYMRLFYLRFQTFPEKPKSGLTTSHPKAKKDLKLSGLTVSPTKLVTFTVSPLFAEFSEAALRTAKYI